MYREVNPCAASQDEHVTMNFDRRRREPERRKRRLSSLLHGVHKRQRREARRAEDHRRGFYVDVYEPVLVAGLLAILILCGLDAYFTLTLLDQGSKELNVFMKLLLERDVNLFVAVKFALTGLALLLVLMHKNFVVFKRLRVAYILPATLLIYALLVKYEIALLIL